jgi:hypothetical protein
MADLDSLIQSKYQEIDQNAQAIDNVLTGGFRTPPTMPSATGAFQNGSDLTKPAGAAATVNAPPATAGSVTLVLDDSIEFIHFGSVYRDKASTFVHTSLDDSDPKLDLGKQLGGRAIMYRAGIEREAVLLAGFFGAHMAALSERDADEGTFGNVMGVVGNLLGGGGGMASKAEPADLNPYVAKVKAIGAQIDVTTLTYDVTHQAGIDLHNLRASYLQYLDGELDKAKTAAPDAGLLASIPMLSSVLPKEIGNIFTLVEKMSTKAFDIYVKLVLGLTRTMMPVVESACRDITIDAITKKTVPLFSVWIPPPDTATTTPAQLLTAPATPASTGIGPLDALVGKVMGQVDKGVTDVNDAADPTLDFLTNPAKPAPGGPFLDQAFGQLNDGSGYLKTAAGVTSIGDIARVAVEQAFGFKTGELPPFVETLVTGVCGAHADFLRGVYGQLVSLDPTKPISEGQLVTAGRAHLVSQIIDAVVHAVSFLDKIRTFNFNLNMFGPIERALSGEALYARGIELVNAELGPHLDPLVEATMKSFAAQLEGARKASQPGMTMEVYLAQLPSLQALLFRKTFFPLWDLMVSTIFKGVSDLLDPMTGRAEDLAKKAHGIVDTVRTGLLRAEGVAHTALTEGLTGALSGTNMGNYAKALAATLPSEKPPAAVTAAATTFPLPSRKTTATGTAVDAAMLAKVAPNDKWQSTPATSASSASSSSSKTRAASATPS